MSDLSQRFLLSILLVHLYASTNANGAVEDLAAIVVTATRVPQSSFDLPLSIDSLNKAQLQDERLLINLSESLGRIPGVVAQNRQNYAQDLQISSRGFGARSGFGVRGLRLYADHIPATMPDGQGQVSHIDLGSAARVEVMRGPFSALYGNSSGGVIAVFTENGTPGAKVEPAIVLGSYATQRASMKLSGATGDLDYVANVSEFRTDGYRDHSAATRDSFNTKLRRKFENGSRLTFVANAVDMPDTHDPLGLTRTQYKSNPRQATPQAYVFNTRKSVSQQQVGLILEHEVGDSDSAKLMLYRGHRAATQFLAIPIATQLPPAHPGGVIDLGRDYWGIDARWTHRGQLAGAPLTLTGGLSYDKLNEDRKGFQNFIGMRTGVAGKLRRAEYNSNRNIDHYVQAQWEPSETWLVMAGVRHSRVRFDSRDHYIVAGNGDGSGSLKFTATTPVLGITWRLSPALNVYASAGKGFETPTMNELSYQPSGASGLNFALQPARSSNLELGLKTLLSEGTRIAVAVFDIATRNEIVTASNSGGRATFQNVGGTRRNGLELALRSDFGNNLTLALAYTNLKATYTDTFRSCRASGCKLATSVVIPAGNRLPGIPASTLYGELSWKHPGSGFSASIEMRRSARVYVDDENSDAAPAYTAVNLSFGLEQKTADWSIREFLRIDNAGNARYAGSVIVNDGNGRFFEPASGRNHLVGVTTSYKF